MQLERDDKGRFLTGSGGPGRKRGSRNKLASEFIEALCDDFEQHGPAVIARVRTDQPAVYMRVVAGILPKQLEAALSVSVFDAYNLEDPQEFAKAFRIARQMIGAEPPVIELNPEAEAAWRADD
jgi:hypothetical protein